VSDAIGQKEPAIRFIAVATREVMKVLFINARQSI
jgi:hypothetical protein